MHFGSMKKGERMEGSRLKALLPGLIGMLLFTVATLYGYQVLKAVVADTEARKQTRETLLHVEEVLSLLKDVESGQRGFLLTGDTTFLGPYQDARARLAPALDRLRQGLEVSRLNGAQLQSMERLIARRVAIAAGNLALRAEQAPPPMPTEAKTRLEEGKAVMDRIRVEFAGLEQDLRQRIQALDNQVRAHQIQARQAAYGMTALAGGLMLLAYALLLREQGRRVRAEQARGEAAVAEARARAQAEAQRHIVDILESLMDGFVALDRDWRYTYVNAQAGRLLGRPPEELIGRHIWTAFPEGRDQPFARAYRRVMESRQAETLEEHYAPWNRWFENRVYPTPDGIAIYFHEITDRKLAEAEARRRGAELESVFQALPDLYFRLRSDGTILDYRARRDVLYAPPEAFLGKRMQDVLPVATGELFAAKLQEAPGADGLVSFEYALPMPEGEHQFEARLACLPDTDERALVVRDITARKSDEAALRQARNDLRAFARKLDADIESERRRLSREVHDQLGQIFTALKLNLLACQPSAPLEQGRVTEFNQLLDQGIRVARRIAADLRPSMLDDLGLGPALEQYARQLGEQAGFTTEVKVTEDARLSPEHRSQLFRIAQEALTNVARHAHAGRVHIEAGPEDGHYVLALADDGLGLSGGRADGLGMLGMRERAELMSAELDVGTSRLGGLRIRVSLPVIEQGEGEGE